MGVLQFLQRITGNYHADAKERARFDANIRYGETQILDLEQLSQGLLAINTRVVTAQHRIISSTLSSGTSGEHELALSEPSKEIPTMAKDDDETRGRCPFAGIRDDESQIIRRKDLVDLGTSFREALEPVGGLVNHLSRQVRSVDHLRAWMIGLVIVTFLGMVVNVISIFVLLHAVRSVQDTAAKVDRLEARTNAIDSNVSAAASAAEQARVEVRAIASTQASTQTIELLSEPDSTHAKATPIVLRVTTRPTPASSK